MQTATLALAVACGTVLCDLALAGGASNDGWRALPLIEDGRMHPAWVQIGYGGFVVEDGSLRTECDEKGMGLLLYRREKFGNCQIRVVYRSKDARSNAGVFVRIDEGILEKVDEKHAPARRDAGGRLTEESLEAFKEASRGGVGPWYAVHHGYEIQISDAGDRFHRTGSVYSLAPAAGAAEKRPTEWKTMVITLDGDRVLVDIDGRRVTTFDPGSKDVPARREWYEPRREPKRPRVGYIGLQNHDPGDVVYFKEVSVRALEKGTRSAPPGGIRQGLPRVTIPVKGDVGEGWKQAVPVAPGGERSDTYDLWVKGGWLYVRRTDGHGDLDWQIKLAEVQQSDVPSISVIDASGFHVSLRAGRYFIRDTFEVLRSIRQRSDGDGAVPRTDLLGDGFTSAGWGSAGPPLDLTLSSWRDDTWFYVASGPDQDRFNCLVRLDAVSQRKPGYGVATALGDIASMFHGQTHLWDDGELLLASRTLRADYEQDLVRQKIRENLPGSVPPGIDASRWLNTKPLGWDGLKGKVVLLDFWATSCAPCVKSLPDVQRLADKYADQGLVVIGIHSQQGSESCADFVKKQKLTFPIAVDTGKTADRYAVDVIPGYFLIDKTGRVVDGWSGKPPREDRIRELLTAVAE